MFKSYLHRVAYTKRDHETIGPTNWGIKTPLFRGRRARELAIEGSRLASLRCSLLTIILLKKIKVGI